MNGLAAAYWQCGRFARSMPLFRKLLKKNQAVQGENSSATFLSAFNLAVNCRHSGQLAESLAHLDGWYERADRTLPLRDPILLNRDVATARDAKPIDELPLASALASLGSTQLNLNRYEEAEAMLRECLKIRQAKSPQAFTTSNAKSMLGGALLGQEKYADAEELLLAGYRGLKAAELQVPVKNRVLVTQALERLVKLYEAWGKPDEAAKWRAELKSRPRMP